MVRSLVRAAIAQKSSAALVHAFLALNPRYFRQMRNGMRDEMKYDAMLDYMR